MKIFIVFFLLTSFNGFANNNQENYYIKDFKLQNYLGTWYEIARKANSFEKDLDYVTATYTLTDNGKIKVLNKGKNLKNNKISEIEGKAKLKYEDTENILRVSFFGPFYSDYIIVDYDRLDYSWALVIGKDAKYMWILSKTPVLDKKIVEDILLIAKEKGIDLSNLIYPKQ